MERNCLINNTSIQKKKIIDIITKGAFMFITLLCASMIFIIFIFIFLKGIQPFTTKYLIDGQYYSVNFFTFISGNFYFKHPNIFGIGYIIINTIYVVSLCLVIAVPISILSALFICKIAPKPVGNFLNVVIELLAAVPSIIYGLFGIGIINKLVDKLALLFNYQSAGGISILSTVLVLAIMIIPTITIISITSINSVKKDIINGSIALGASMMQTNFKVVLSEAKSGIFSGIILGVGRALGEATAISFVCGNSLSGPNFNIFDTTRTLTSTMLLGLTEAEGIKYDIKFSIGLVLIIIILLTNILLNLIKRRLSK